MWVLHMVNKQSGCIQKLKNLQFSTNRIENLLLGNSMCKTHKHNLLLGSLKHGKSSLSHRFETARKCTPDSFRKNSREESSVCRTISCTDITIRLLLCVVNVGHIQSPAPNRPFLACLWQNWALLQAWVSQGPECQASRARAQDQAVVGRHLHGQR